MEIKEKRDYIKKYCESREDCPGCPIYDFPDEGCFYETTADDAKVERNYKAITEGNNMKTNNDLSRNGSGYRDPTAEKAIIHIAEQGKKASRVIKTIKSVAHLAGFEIEGRIVLRDKATGGIWK